MRKLFLWDLRKQSGKKNLNKQMSKESQVINWVCDFLWLLPFPLKMDYHAKKQVMLRLYNNHLQITTDKGENIVWKIMSRLLRLIIKGR